MGGTVVDDRYELRTLAGSGGMAEVFLAYDRVLGRDVALKLLRGRYAGDEDFVERFRREAKSAAALSSPFIVPVFDRGETSDGAYYIAMEYLPGGTLEDRITRAGRLSPHEAVELAVQVTEALQAAHGRGVVHRDVKPGNVLLTRSGHAKVADFGIARAADATTISEPGDILGSARYMSPSRRPAGGSARRATCTRWAWSSTRCSPGGSRSTSPPQRTCPPSTRRVRRAARGRRTRRFRRPWTPWS